MRIIQTVDKEIDQSEIESKYLWYPSIKSTNRINLQTVDIDFSGLFPNSISITHYMSLPNNQFYCIGFENFGKHHQCQFISDENLKLKIIEIAAKNAFNRSYFTCYYDDSIYTFECFFDLLKASTSRCQAKRYLISQNKWIRLSDLPFKCPISVAGFSQNLLIAADNSDLSGLWIYDINLDVYTHFSINNFDTKASKMILKNERKIYLVVYQKFYEIYVSDNLWSEWTFVNKYEENIFIWKSSPHILYNKSIYYFRNSTLYKFELASFETKAVEDLKSQSN